MILGYALALVIGLMLGLLGGGGSILTVPVLHYVMGYEVKEAIPMSLVVVGLASGFGAVTHWRAGTVHWRSALAFAPPAIAGTVLGAELGLRVDAGVQLLVFALVMLAAAVSMLRPAQSDEPHRPRPLPVLMLIGAGVGVLTGFVGVGGGFIYVPALVLLGGLAIQSAIGTSLVLIMVSCVAGVLRYHGALALDWRAMALFVSIAIVGVAAGSRLVPYLSQQVLKKSFAIFLLGMGTLVLLHGR